LMPAAPLALALTYAIGRITEIPAPSIEFMVKTHGLLNAVGFAGLSVWCWTKLLAVGEVEESLEKEDVHVVVA
jgi:YndJ-like protein